MLRKLLLVGVLALSATTANATINRCVEYPTYTQCYDIPVETTVVAERFTHYRALKSLVTGKTILLESNSAFSDYIPLGTFLLFDIKIRENKDVGTLVK